MSLEEFLEGKDFEQIPLKVSSGILLHIGAGIYSSVAGALKELVSNSYDADALRVVISTDYPKFEQIRVVDDGVGMSLAHFTLAMQSIGSSLKGILQPSGLTLKYERPVIGHLGIGLMSLSQVCYKATIESQFGGHDTKFVAQLDFSEFKRREEEKIKSAKLDLFRETAKQYGGIKELEEYIKNLDPDTNEHIEALAKLELAKEANRVYEDSEFEDLEDEYLGYCVVYPNIPSIPGKQGTSITLEEIDEGVKAALLDRDRASDPMPKYYEEMSWDNYRDEVNSWSWEELCRRLQLRKSHLSYQSLPKYHQFLWELALMTPLPYFEEGPVLLDSSILKDKKKELAIYDFSLIVDNQKLLKPILLPSGSLAKEVQFEKEYDYHIENISKDEDVGGSRLKYHGYIFWQRKQVELSAERGIQIYIRNVGIGLYDRTLLGFSKVNPTSRAGQISGEIYVEEGLEQALNVDRNSFRETDAHYLTLQRHLWKVLGSAKRRDGVMGISVDAYWKRRDRKEDQAFADHIKELTEAVLIASEGTITLEFHDEPNPEPYILKRNRVIVFNRSNRWPRSSLKRHFYQRLLIPLGVAASKGASPEKILALLEDKLLK